MLASLVLANANVVQQYSPFCHQLVCDDKGYYQLKDKTELTDSFATEDESFIAQTGLLLSHWEKFKQYILQQEEAISSLAVDSLVSFYEVSKQYEGLLFLANQMSSKITQSLRFLILSNDQESLAVRKLIEQLSGGYAKEQKTFIQNLVENKEKKLYDVNSGMSDTGDVLFVGAVVSPKKFAISTQVQANFAPQHGLISTRAFSDVMRFQIEESEVDMFVYPSFDTNNYSELTEKDILQGKHSAKWLVNNAMQNNTAVTLPYVAPHLLATMQLKQGTPIWLLNSLSFSALETNVLVKQCQLLVEIAKVQDYPQVVFFAPYHFSAKAYSLGFYSNDDMKPTLGEQHDIVTDAIENKKKVKNLFNVDRTENKQMLLRPFIFDLNHIDKPMIYISKNQEKTSYGALIKNQPLLAPHKIARKGLFPQFQGLPTIPFSLSQHSLIARETGNKPKPSKTSYSLEKVDYELAQDFQKMLHIGETASSAQDNLMLRVRPL